MRAILFFCVLLLPWPAAAGEVAQEATWDRPRVVVAVSMMPLRAEPDIESEVIGRARLMWPVTMLPDMGPDVVIAGREDRWVRVALPICADEACKTFKAGWTLDSFLGYDERFERLDGLAATTLTDYDGRNVLAYGIRADGEFSRWSAPCVAGACSVTPGPKPDCPESESRRDAFCVMSGLLYRYRDLVRGKDAAGQWLPMGLRVLPTGTLCPLESRRSIPADAMYSVRCSYSDLEPAAAIMAGMDEKRARLALVAADMLNLRAEPSTGAEIVTRAPRGSAVTVLPHDGPAITVGGQADRWVRIWIDSCYSFTESGLCQPGAAGWVVDGFLAYEDRLAPMTEWRAGMIGGYGGDYAFSYLFLKDGTVEYSESCGDYRLGESCTVEGRLYRYRDLVLARFPSSDRHHILSIDGKGRLCFPPAEEKGEILYETGDGRPTRCDR